MRVEVGGSPYEGHARCIECAPNVFGYDDITNIATVLQDADLEADRRDMLRAERGYASTHSLSSMTDSRHEWPRRLPLWMRRSRWAASMHA